MIINPSQIFLEGSLVMIQIDFIFQQFITFMIKELWVDFHKILFSKLKIRIPLFIHSIKKGFLDHLLSAKYPNSEIKSAELDLFIFWF